jgi:hypothetical protein
MRKPYEEYTKSFPWKKRRKGYRELTESERHSILKLIQKGYIITKVAKELKLPLHTVRSYFCKWHPRNYNVLPIHMGHKKDSYYENEEDYSSYPTYKWEDLSKREIEVYLKNN